MNLNAAVSASPGKGPAASLPSPLASVNLVEKEQLGPRLHPKVSLKRFGTEDGAKRDVQAQTWKQTAAPECNSR